MLDHVYFIEPQYDLIDGKDVLNGAWYVYGPYGVESSHDDAADAQNEANRLNKIMG